ncbi:site-specific integrase [Salegentibacter sp. F188]|uniref:Site-specific integrase n=1 Tax=Autumnicola patrickiae TaxID=3075591 RepID=A0ABU3E3D8_9FLAO|nr:site-specific integrase [Salegentibacter sp. F188]MDT0690466.1 site-specific integrase [Salegentibacter sp. F188]
MARARLVLDTRKGSRSKVDGLYPLAVKVFHRKARLIRLSCSTSRVGWDENNMILKKSVFANKDLDCDTINKSNYNKLHAAKSLIIELGKTINDIDVDRLVECIKEKWDKKLDSELRRNLDNEVTINEWSEVLIKRKLKEQKPGTAQWYRGGVAAITKFNHGKPVKFHEITVTFLKNFEVEHKAKGTSLNGISVYLRAVRAIYNYAIQEEWYEPIKHPFSTYKIPTTRRTKKKALSKEKIIAIRNLQYEEGTNLWHSRNYLLCMFNCRGMNFIDLAKLKIKDIAENRLYYGRSKTGDRLSVKMTNEFLEILKYYIKGKTRDEFIFPIGYDGSVENFTRYKSSRRLSNKLFKIIAEDAGIEEKITTYYIRHSWATIAKEMGISTEIISEGLGHHSLKTTQIYLRDFDNKVLDEANDLIVS